MKEATVADLTALVTSVGRGVGAPARLYLVSQTSHLAEGWRGLVTELELAGDDGGGALREVVRDAAAQLGVGVIWESPADIIPLPAQWRERARKVTRPVGMTEGGLELCHFDPYSVVMRLVARGDEPDYVAALQYVRHGWVELARLEGLIADMLPRMTMKTIAQDPAEFRRKFKGLRQLCASEAARAEALGFTAATWV